MEEKKSTSSERINFVIAQAIFLIALITFNRWLSESDFYKQGNGNHWRIGVNSVAVVVAALAFAYYQNRFHLEKPVTNPTLRKKLGQWFTYGNQQIPDVIDLLSTIFLYLFTFLSIFSIVGIALTDFRFGTFGFLVSVFLWSLASCWSEVYSYKKGRKWRPVTIPFTRFPKRPPRQIGYTVKFLFCFIVPILVANILFRLNRSEEFRDGGMNLLLTLLLIVVFVVVSVRVFAGLWASIISFNRTYENFEGISWKQPLRYPLFPSEYAIVALGSFQVLYGLLLLPYLHKPLPTIDTYTPFLQALQLTIGIVLINLVVSIAVRRQRKQSTN